VNREGELERLIKQGVSELGRLAAITGLDARDIREVRRRVRTEARIQAAKSQVASERLTTYCRCRHFEVEHGEFGDHSGGCRACGPVREEPLWAGSSYLGEVGCDEFDADPKFKPRTSVYSPFSSKSLRYDDPGNCCPKCGHRQNEPWFLARYRRSSYRPAGTGLTKYRRTKTKGRCPHPFHIGSDL